MSRDNNYDVWLTSLQDVRSLKYIMRTNPVDSRRYKWAQILLLSGESLGEGLEDNEIVKRVNTNISTIRRLKKKFNEYPLNMIFPKPKKKRSLIDTTGIYYDKRNKKYIVYSMFFKTKSKKPKYIGIFKTVREAKKAQYENDYRPYFDVPKKQPIQEHKSIKRYK
jgi:hypothetical protein